MSDWKDILKEDLEKALMVKDPSTGITYKKWDGQGRPPIKSLLESREGQRKGWDYVLEQAGRRPGEGVVPYDNSGFQHDTMGHQLYEYKGRHFCLKCQVEFRR